MGTLGALMAVAGLTLPVGTTIGLGGVTLTGVGDVVTGFFTPDGTTIGLTILSSAIASGLGVD